MGHTNTTPNLHLPQFIGSDKPTWLSDVNGAMLAIDNAYGTIEADASSASTAASGAVTVANAAQTAADAAGTAAATAGTNASQALSTANNAATVALQAKENADDAIEIVTGKLLASVETDGVKTFAQLFDELYAQIDKTKLTYNATYVDHTTATGVKVVAHIEYISSDEVCFTNARVYGSLTTIDAHLRSHIIRATDPREIYFSITDGASPAVHDQTSAAPGAGRVISIYA